MPQQHPPERTAKNLASRLSYAAKQQDADDRRAKIMEQQSMLFTPPTPKPTTITPESILEAWSLISPAGHSVLTKTQVLDNLRLLFPRMSAKEVKELVGTGNMSVNKLNNLLLNTDVPPVDANAEAFKILDPQEVGFIDANVICKLLEQVHGVDKVDQDDMQLILQLCDADKDGRISLKDFASIGSWAPVKEVPTDQTRRLMVEKLKESRGIRPLDDDD